MNSSAKKIALGGLFAALAMVVMCLGGLIPVATYVSPMICALLCHFIFLFTGAANSWAWYGAVSVLSLFFSPDKEAAFVFLFLGYYPIIRRYFKKNVIGILLKFVFFNVSVFALYMVTIFVFGMYEIQKEFAQLGRVMLIVMLVLGNLCFYMLDFLLGRFGLNGKKR